MGGRLDRFGLCTSYHITSGLGEQLLSVPSTMGGREPLTVMAWEDFMADPTRLCDSFWRDEQSGLLQFDPSRVVSMAEDKDRTMSVRIMAEMEDLKRELMGKQILLRRDSVLSKNEVGLVYSVSTTWTGKLAVLLNPAHPAVRQPMAQMFRRGVELLRDEENFCLEFDLGSSLRPCYSELLGDNEDSYVEHKPTNSACFYITNLPTRKSFCDCDQLWFFLSLFSWSLSAPFYLVHRQRRPIPKRGALRANVYRFSITSGHQEVRLLQSGPLRTAVGISPPEYTASLHEPMDEPLPYTDPPPAYSPPLPPKPGH